MSCGDNMPTFLRYYNNVQYRVITLVYKNNIFFRIVDKYMDYHNL